MTQLRARLLRAPNFGARSGPRLSSVTRARALRRAASATLTVSLGLSLFGCRASVRHSDGLEPSSLPAELRADYAVFAQRCSKCHTLARPLNSGISDDSYWVRYVAKMRRQPASGITQEDAAPILRFLHYYSVEQSRKNEKGEEKMELPSPPPAPSATPAPPATPALSATPASSTVGRVPGPTKL
jgi:hypothetical protein